jgi:hypothetical protein
MDSITEEGMMEFEEAKVAIGAKIKSLRVDAGYKSYEVFAWENNISRIQYWKMEQETNCTLKSLYRVLKIHELSFQDFFNVLNDK